MKTDDRISTETDLDKMLSSYFKAELPDPFPEMKLSLKRAEMPMPAMAFSRALSDEQASSKSRFSLAVSVALLLGGCWYLSGQIGGEVKQRPLTGKGDGSAKITKDLLKASEQPKNSTAR